MRVCTSETCCSLSHLGCALSLYCLTRMCVFVWLSNTLTRIRNERLEP